jgi:glycerophosphoryl diester phosphodiesterase
VRQIEAGSIGFNGGQCFHFLHGGEAANRQFLVGARALSFPCDLIVGQCLHDFGGNARRKRAGRNDRFGFDECQRRDDCRFTHVCVVIHDRVHADQRIAADLAAVNRRTVTDMAVLADDRVSAGKSVEDAAILHVGACLHDDATEVAAQAGARADVDARADDDVTDQDGAWMNERAWIDDRGDAIDGVDFRHVSLSWATVQGTVAGRIIAGPILTVDTRQNACRPGPVFHSIGGALRLLGSLVPLTSGLLGVFLLATMSAQAFDLQGHRGARGLLPENSLAAFSRALAIGVTTLELDTVITKDGVVVISHDARLNPDITRTAEGMWIAAPTLPINTLTYADLARYDVGMIRPQSEYAARFPLQESRPGTRIPRLAELFQMVHDQGATAVRFNIETKITPVEPGLTPTPEVFAHALIAEIRRAGVTARTTIQSFDWRTLAVVQREAPEIPTAYLTAQQSWMDNIGAHRAEPSPWTGKVTYAVHRSVPKMVKAAGGAIWSPYSGDVTQASLREAQTMGLRVIPWTVNSRPEMEQLIDWGVDGLISDYPDVLRAVVQAKGLVVATPVPRQSGGKMGY